MNDVGLAAGQLMHMPAPASAALAVLLVARGVLWVWLAAHRTATAVVIEREQRRRMIGERPGATRSAPQSPHHNLRPRNTNPRLLLREPGV